MNHPKRKIYFRVPWNPLLRVWPYIRGTLNIAGTLGMTILTAGHARRVAPFEIQYHDVPMPLPNLPASFEGFRIVQLSDLHIGRRSPVAFIQSVIDRVNAMPHDLVVITGDILTSRTGSVSIAGELLRQLRPPVIATYGNHDYADFYPPWTSSKLAEALQIQLESIGITVLRNHAVPIDHSDGRLWIVGLEDLWSTRFQPEDAFANVNGHCPIIALSHNPDTADHLAPFNPDWILAGHTHGGQVRLPILGSMILPIKNKHLDQGLHQIGPMRLYVSRGVGFYRQVRFRCPPEVPTFVLTRSGGSL